jgi:hypothetical protein
MRMHDDFLDVPCDIVLQNVPVALPNQQEFYEVNTSRH